MAVSQHFLLRAVLEEWPSEAYVAQLPAVQALHRSGLPLDASVTFLAGENGTGKSTLLEAMAVASGFNAEGGTRNFNFSTQATHSSLGSCLRLTKGCRLPRDGFFLRAESFYNVASEVDRLEKIGKPGLLQSYGGKSLHEQSHGESFLALVLNRFHPGGLYFLDEPEAALSVARQMALLTHMTRLARSGAQFLVATHSPILLACPEARIFVLSEQGIAQTAYEETESYCLTRQFLENPARMLHYLLEEDLPQE